MRPGLADCPGPAQAFAEGELDAGRGERPPVTAGAGQRLLEEIGDVVIGRGDSRRSH
jgi:hypothetical protein